MSDLSLSDIACPVINVFPTEMLILAPSSLGVIFGLDGCFALVSFKNTTSSSSVIEFVLYK